ncbi:MAG: deoxyribose-phosphate aldolase [Prevotellaceae bacterium]|jgi:deoxyribose-phosphate aldolase|nr:deoxyribose-phosphate aldolase [Prevotellaceae bacterium]
MKDLDTLFKQYDFSFTDESVKNAVKDILTKNFAKNDNKEVYRKCLSLIDLTSLNATDTEEKIEKMMQKVNDFPQHFPDTQNVPAVCVYPALVPIARKTLNADTKIAAVSACFPSSQTFIEAKIAEVALTALAGADEIDVVISLGKFLGGNYGEVFEELEEIKSACRNSHLKVILESGSLPSCADIKKASIIAIAAGADFIKTSTGKSEPAATLEAAYVMCQTIKEFYEKNGVKTGFKPAGGVAVTKEAVEFYTVVEAVLGEEWLNSDLFRFGASRLANNLLTSIYDKEIKYY